MSDCEDRNGNPCRRKDAYRIDGMTAAQSAKVERDEERDTVACLCCGELGSKSEMHYCSDCDNWFCFDHFSICDDLCRKCAGIHDDDQEEERLNEDDDYPIIYTKFDDTPIFFTKRSAHNNR